jgi:hypothetical protein
MKIQTFHGYNKCTDAWKQIKKCMKTQCKDEFMDTKSKIFGYKWENAKMHGLQNVKVFMDAKCKDFKDMVAWKQIHMQRCTETNAKISGCKCKEAKIQMQNNSGYKC